MNRHAATETTMPEHNEKLRPRPAGSPIHFRELRPSPEVFQPVFPLCEVWSGDPSAETGHLLGHVQRTYRNSATHVPGEPVWVFRDEETGQILESLHSETDLRKRILAWRGAGAQPPVEASSHGIRDAAVLFVGLPESDEEQKRAIAQVRKILDRYFDGFTITPAEGSFRGETEPSLAIFLTPGEGAILTKAASEIRAALGEEGVGIYFQGRHVRVTKDAQGVIA